MITQFQIWGAVLNEMVSMLYMTRQSDLIDLVMNFVAFEAINNIDNIFRAASKNDVFIALSDVGEISFPRDTAKGKEGGKYFDNKKNTFSDPQIEEGFWVWYMIRVVHQVQRVLYKGLYFYMFPYFVIPLSYYVYTM